MRVTVRQLKRIISEAMGDEAMTASMPGRARRDGMSWSMPYGHAGHSESLRVVEPLYAARGDTPSVGAQIATLWSTFQAEPQGRGPRGSEMIRDPGSSTIALFREFLNHPSSGSATFPLEVAFRNFVSHLEVYDADDVAISAADVGYENYATPEEAAANEAARKRSEARSAPRPSPGAVPSVATESLRRDLRRRLRSL